MKKIMSCLLILGLVACQKKEIQVVAPTSTELGSICTLVTEFSNDIYNISLFYNENEEYPILNKDDFNYIAQLGLKYSNSGMKDVSKYTINQEKAEILCEMEHPQVTNIAIEIPKSEILKFKSELKNHKFYYEVEKEGELFQVEIDNKIVSSSDLEMNYRSVNSLNFSDQEISKLDSLKSDEFIQIYLDPDHEINIQMNISEIIHKDGSQTINQDNLFVNVGEAYQYSITVADSKAIATNYLKIATLIQLSKDDVNEHTYLNMNGGVKTSALKDYIIYENDTIVLYDINGYLYHYDQFLDYVKGYFNNIEIDEEKINELHQQFIQSIQQVY